MNFLGKIFEKLNLSFVQKGNKNKTIKQKNGELQICQEKQGITNIFNFETLNVSNIKELAGLDIPENNENLLKSAGQRFLVEQQIKQENFKSIVDDAHLEEIENPQELDKDWFLKWMEISQYVSKENIQKILAKIISGEVKKTGTFSLRTLEIIKNLSKEELDIFQRLCDISYSIPSFGDEFTCVICEPFGSPGDNSLGKFNLFYSDLTKIQDAGLIHTSLTAWREMEIPLIFTFPFTLGDEKFTFLQGDDTEEMKKRNKIINFTKAGLELRSVLNIKRNNDYSKEFIEWMEKTCKMIMQV